MLRARYFLLGLIFASAIGYGAFAQDRGDSRLEELRSIDHARSAVAAKSKSAAPSTQKAELRVVTDREQLSHTKRMAQLPLIKAFQPEIVGRTQKVPEKIKDPMTGRELMTSGQIYHSPQNFVTEEALTSDFKVQLLEFEKNLPLGQCGSAKLESHNSCSLNRQSCEFELKSEHCFLERSQLPCAGDFENRMINGTLGRHFKICVERLGRGSGGGAPKSQKSSPGAG